jgi:thioredoxin reductase
MFDVVIVGAGPAGLNAALILGRCQRKVLLCDTGKPRNAASWHLNGFLSRDGIDPGELRRIGREQLKPYNSVKANNIEVVGAEREGKHFAIWLADGSRVQSRKLLLTTGLVDKLPDIEGFQKFWGRGVHNCPYCDGWEHRDQAIAVYAPGADGVSYSLEMTVWSRDIVLCTDGKVALTQQDRDRLGRQGIRIIEDPIARLEGSQSGLERICFKNSHVVDCQALFFCPQTQQSSELAVKLGCDLGRNNAVETRSCERTNIPGLFIAGDASRRVQFAIVAAAEGAMAAIGINTELWKEDTA